MNPVTRLVALCAFVPVLAAQDGPPVPSPELQKLAPLIGNWTGSGTMNQPGKATRWTAAGTYRWTLGNFWVQEDFTITFEGHDAPLCFRAYLGWDAERKTFVNLAVSNGGDANLHDVAMMPDGTQVQVMLQHQEGMPYAERSLLEVDGDQMTHSIDVMMPQGASLTIVDGTFTRTKTEAPSAFATKGTWMGAAPHAEMQKVARMAGAYEVTGTMVMMPGEPAMKIKGADSYQPVFGGTVLACRTDGEAEGMPGKYECDAFWAFDPKKNCLVAVFVDNMGSVGRLDARYTADGKAIVGTAAAPMMGQLTASRSVTTLDAEGRPTSYVSHLLFGTAAPCENFRATYRRK